MLSKKSDTVDKTLSYLGLSPDEIEVYEFLCKKGFVSALEMSKSLPISRTKVYRILDDLYEKGIIKQQLTDRGLRFGVGSVDDLELLFQKDMLRMKEIQMMLPESISYLQNLGIAKENNANIRMYRGRKGLEQVTYNSTKAKGRVRIYEAQSTMDAFLDHDVAEDMRKRFIDANIKTCQLTNKTSIEEYTDAYDDISKYWEVRYVDPRKLQIDFEVLIYDDIYCLYSNKGDDLYCVEFQDKRLASMQAQLFDYIWSTAQEMKILTQKGKALLEYVTEK